MKTNKLFALKQILMIMTLVVMTSLGMHEMIKAASVETVAPTVTAEISASATVSATNQVIGVNIANVVVNGGSINSLDLHFLNTAGVSVYDIAASKTSDTTYAATVDAAVLNPQYGTYTITATASILAADGSSTIVGIESKAFVDLVPSYCTGMSAGSPDKEAGTFVVTAGAIYGAGAIDDVSIVVTSASNPEKTYTYSGRKVDSAGNYTAKVKVSDLGYTFGQYNISLVVTLADGVSSVASTCTYSFSPSNFVRIDSTDRKKLTKKVYIYNPTVKKDVTATVWSKKSDKDDAQTYKLTSKNGHLEFTIDMSKLRYSGTINISFNKKLKNISFEAKKKDIVKNGWYYEKASNKKTYKFYYKNGKKVTNLTKVLGIKKETNFHIEVNRKHNRVTVYAYDDETESWCIPVISFVCSVGVNTSETATPTGTYKSDRKHRWKALMEDSWGQYATHIVRGVYFHSVAGSTTDSYGISAYSYNKLGRAASHGCIRLTVRDAKWIYDYCAIGTQIKIGDWDYEGPLTPQKVTKIPAGQHYDPTDPAVKKNK